MRPTKYLGTGRGKRWTNVDRALAEGLLHYEASLNSLGIPWDRATDPSRTFEIDEVVDYAAEAYETAQEEYRRGGNTSPGLRIVVLDRGVSTAGLADDPKGAAADVGPEPAASGRSSGSL